MRNAIEPPLRFDPTLGIVRLCPQCGDEWPFDAEFWYVRDGDLSPAWPRRCIACCAEYFASRRRQAMTLSKAERVYLIPDPVRCGTNMKHGATCGRAPGHTSEHRSVACMATRAANRRAQRKAA